MLPRIVLRLELLLLVAFTGIILLAGGVGQLLPPAPVYALSLSQAENAPDVYGLDGFRGVMLNLTKNGGRNRDAAVAPDGRWIAYTSMLDANEEIYVLNLMTGAALRLTGDMAPDFDAAWSPDGVWLAFASGRGSSVDLYVIPAAGGTPRPVASTPNTDFLPAWSPDGQQLAFVSGEDYGLSIYVTHADGSGQPGRLTAYQGVNTFPTWSPDGQWLAFVSDQTGRLNLYLLPVACLETPGGCESANPRQLTRQGFDQLGPLWWSADGQLRFWAQTGTTLELYTLPANCDLHPGSCVPQPLTHLARSLLAGRRQVN